MDYSDEMLLANTSLPTIKIKEEDLGRVYPYIGRGGEGTVYQYDEKTVIKIFNVFPYRGRLPLKFRKIEVMGKLCDEALINPRGLVGFENGESDDIFQEGVFMDAVDRYPEYGSFEDLYYLKEWKKLLEVILKADEVIQRFHQKGIRLGDVKPSNILIDKNWDPKFIDVDNMAYMEFPYDIADSKTYLLEDTFGKDLSRRDSDIYLFSLMALEVCMASVDMYMGCKKDYLTKMVQYLKVNPTLRDGLRLIFSDAENKPYIGEILKEMGPEAFEFTKAENMVLTHLL